MSVNDSDIPQWKKDLIARLRNQNKRTANIIGENFVERQQQQQQLYPPSMVVESSPSSSSALVQHGNRCESVVLTKPPSDVIKTCKMVQESVICNNWASFDHHHNHHHYKNGNKGDYFNANNNNNNKSDDNDSDKNSSEDDLHYGPGIVNKLKNKYLSLVLRESNQRLTILRKAASLENILDDQNDDDKQQEPTNLYKKFNNPNEITNQTNRYRKMTRGNDMVKRARSVETISRHNIETNYVEKPKRESMHEDIFINYNNNCDKVMVASSSNSQRINRPKRIQPVVNEKEKPPVDFVKQTKLIFERHRPELYKKSTTATPITSEVAAKVANYKSIIVQNKTKPPIKQKPTILKINEKSKLRSKIDETPIITGIVKTPPDISQLDIKNTVLSSDTPDLIITSSPVSPSPTYHAKTTETFIKEEIRNNHHNDDKNDRVALELSPIRNDVVDEDDDETIKRITPQSMQNIDKASTTVTFNFVKNKPTIIANNQNVSNEKIPVNQPLKLDTTAPTTITTVMPASPKIIEKIHKLVSPPLKSSPTTSSSAAAVAASVVKNPQKPPLTMLEIEKNLINTAKTLEQPKSIINSNNNVDNSENNLQKVPKFIRKPPPKREPDNNSIVFKFTDRKDVPDYLHDDGLIRVAKIERPKVGEGGIILLPGASIEESFTDDDEAELMRSLEAPPSPCDVTFINDNILIDGKSSLITQKTKRSSKMKISFVEEGPEVYEYPSESSFSVDESILKQTQQMGGHAVPSLAGSTLANYTPKSTEDFQPGVTRTITKSEENPKLNDSSSSSSSNSDETILQETEKPIVFSAGTNSDILF